MGFYAPDSLVHEAQRRGIAVLGLDVNASPVQCTVEQGAVRLGLGYVKGAVAEEVRELVAERERGGAFRDLGDLAARTATRRDTLEQLAWSGACDSLAQSRRQALWQLGIVSSGESVGEGMQLALPIELPQTPRLRSLDRWQRLLADYATSGVTVDDHVMAALRTRLSVPMLATSAQLACLPHEDEWGTVNLIVPGAVYERHRPLARAEPLLLARGRLERSPSGVLNVLVRELVALERFLGPAEEEMGMGEDARVSLLPGTDRVWTAEEKDGAEMGANMRAVVPPVQSFASGRRR
jgi:error-prone DNA polymerase